MLSQTRKLALLLVSCAVVGGVVPVAEMHAQTARPNPGRFFTKIGSDAAWWESASDDTKNVAVKNLDLVLVDRSMITAKAVADELFTRKYAVGNPGLKLVRYWNMWSDYNKSSEASYSSEMFLYQNWPNTTSGTRGGMILKATSGKCEPVELLDVSKPALTDEIQRVIRNFLPSFDGAFFDMSAWDTFTRQYDIARVGVHDGSHCDVAPFSASTGFVSGWLPVSADQIVKYHQKMQSAIDPYGDDSKLHFCNLIPRQAGDANPAREAQFLAIMDGCQMDTAWINQTGPHFITWNWKYQLDTLVKYVGMRKYFLSKIPYDDFGWTAQKRTDALEFGFASFLLGADGKYALFYPAYNFTAWDTDPILTAPLGNAAGAYEAVPGSAADSYLFMRRFDNGLVIVNAGKTSRTVGLPAGTFANARTGEAVSGSVTLASGAARILVGGSTPPPPPPPDGDSAICNGQTATIVGTSGSDVLTGTAGDDVIAGLEGDDVIDGQGGNDVICSGPGADTLRGGDGSDKLIGNDGRDQLLGGADGDYLFGGADVDSLWGEAGNDLLKGGDGDDLLDGGLDSDYCNGDSGSANTAIACEKKVSAI